MFDVMDTVSTVLKVTTGVISTLQVSVSKRWVILSARMAKIFFSESPRTLPLYSGLQLLLTLKEQKSQYAFTKWNVAAMLSFLKKTMVKNTFIHFD